MHSLIKLFKIIIIISLIGVSTNFALNNQDSVAIDLGPFAKTISLRLYVLTFVFFGLGCACSAFYFFLDSAKKSMIIRKQNKTVSKLRALAESTYESDRPHTYKEPHSFEGDISEAGTSELDGTKENKISS